MKKILLVSLLISLGLSSFSQGFSTDDLSKYSRHLYGKTWIKAAQHLSILPLDEYNNWVFVRDVTRGSKTIDQLFIDLSYWLTTTFDNKQSPIILSDKEDGILIAKVILNRIVVNYGALNGYEYSIAPTIKIEIKESIIKITTSLKYYDVVINVDGSYLGDKKNAILLEREWAIANCFPYNKKDDSKKSSAKAFVLTHAYMNTILDKIEDIVNKEKNN